MDIEIPGYTLLRTLGKGGMATVYLARQDILERNVALKVMSRSLAEDPTFGARFMREAKIVSQLVHPNIVTVHEVGQHRGCYFLSMEYIDGHDLRTVRKSLDLQGKIKVVEDIARALYYAGEKGYVHRDIKPENIMFRASDGSAVLTDFGIAKAVESDLTMTQTGTAIGTPHYMSPEQAKGKDVDHRSDLYSLGVVFYLLLVGRVPFDADTAIAIGIKHLTEAVPRLPAQYASLQHIVDGLMAKDLNERYQNGLDLLNELRHIDLELVANDEFEAEQQPTIAADVPTDVGQAAVNEAPDQDDSSRFTIEFEAVEPIMDIDSPPRSFLPTFFASLFVLFAISVFVYFARPAYLESYIRQLEKHASESFVWVQGHVKQGAEVVGETFTEFKQELKHMTTAMDESSSSIADEPENKSEAVDTSGADLQPSIKRPEYDAPTTPLEERHDLKKQSVLHNQVAVPQQDVAPTIPDVPSLNELLKDLKQIQEKNAHEGGLLADEVLAHRRVLEHYPNHSATNASLENIKNNKYQEIMRLAQKGDEPLVTRRFDSFKAIFADELSDAEVKKKSDALKTQLTIAELFERVDQQIQQQQFTTPVKNNAVTSLNAILALEPKNAVALRKLEEIADAYYQKAKRAFDKHKLSDAKRIVQRALQANSKHKPSRSLVSQIQGLEKRQARLNKALAAAKKYADLGYLYTPEGANAYDTYKRALKLDSENITAQEGLNGLMDKLSVQVWALVGEAKFDQAKSKLSRPLILMPKNKRLLAMQSAVNDVASER